VGAVLCVHSFECFTDDILALFLMPSNPHILAGAHEISISHSTFNAAGGDIIYNTTYVNPSTEEILAALKPVERAGHANMCMPGTRQKILREIDYWLDDFTDDSKVTSLLSLGPNPGGN
jgi:hypothetical protein